MNVIQVPIMNANNEERVQLESLIEDLEVVCIFLLMVLCCLFLLLSIKESFHKFYFSN